MWSPSRWFRWGRYLSLGLAFFVSVGLMLAGFVVGLDGLLSGTGHPVLSLVLLAFGVALFLFSLLRWTEAFSRRRVDEEQEEGRDQSP